jgi:uncharacterized OB-fold protein
LVVPPVRATPDELLSAPYVLEYTYQRSTGPVIGRFLTGLRDRRIEGARTAAGRVLVPPTEWDPDTGQPIADFVEVGQTGVVTTWAWMAAPRRFQPLDRPFAWALILLDGADTAMLHAVDAGKPERMATGMRVVARWRDERVGSMRDLACFVPVETAATDARVDATDDAAPAPASAGPVTLYRAPVRLDYTVTAGHHLSRYLHGLAERRILGARCGECTKVYVPSRGACPTCGVPTLEEVEVADIGTVTTFCIIRIPFEKTPFPPPYAAAAILLDGADVPIFHLVRGIAVDQVRMGMRVKALWAPANELGLTLRSIRWFEPTGEPDAEFATYAKHL